jgi:DNA-directed RNA polymerase specialized sigma24 family protein
VIEQLAQKDSDWRLMAFKITKDKDLADDIVQEMYLKAHTFITKLILR